MGKIKIEVTKPIMVDRTTMNKLKQVSSLETGDVNKLRGFSITNIFLGIILISCNSFNILHIGSSDMYGMGSLLHFWFGIWSLCLSLFPLVAGILGTTSPSRGKLMAFMVLNIITAVNSVLSIIGTAFIVYFGGVYVYFGGVYDYLYMSILFLVCIINLVQCFISVFCSIFAGRYFVSCGCQAENKTSNDADTAKTMEAGGRRNLLMGFSITHIIFGIILISGNFFNIVSSGSSLHLWFANFGFCLSFFPLITGIIGSTSLSRRKLIAIMVLNIITAVNCVLFNIASFFIVYFGGFYNDFYFNILFYIWNCNLVQCGNSVYCSIFVGRYLVSCGCRPENKITNDADTAKALSILMAKNKQVSIEPSTTSVKNKMIHYQNIYKV